MEMPSVKNVARDQKRNITYEVMAYRELTREEVDRAVRRFLSTERGWPAWRNLVCTIVTLVGEDESI